MRALVIALACVLGCGSRTSDVAGEASCEEDATALAKRFEPLADGSTLVVRVGYRTGPILGWHFFTDPSSAQVAQGDALFAAETDTGFGNLPIQPPLSGDGSVDEFIFFWSAGDLSAEAAVSVRTGKTVFGGSIFWAGIGEIKHPTTWSAPEELGNVCSPAEPVPSSRGVSAFEGALDSPEVSGSLAAVWNTAIPGALSRSGQMALDAVVLYYPPAVGGYDPRQPAQSIVIINLARVKL